MIFLCIEILPGVTSFLWKFDSFCFCKNVLAFDVQELRVFKLSSEEIETKKRFFNLTWKQIAFILIYVLILGSKITNCFGICVSAITRAPRPGRTPAKPWQRNKLNSCKPRKNSFLATQEVPPRHILRPPRNLKVLVSISFSNQYQVSTESRERCGLCKTII